MQGKQEFMAELEQMAKGSESKKIKGLCAKTVSNLTPSLESYAIETHMRQNYRGHLGDGLSPHQQSLHIPSFGARLPTVTTAHIQREASLMNTPEVGMLFSDGDDTPSSPQGVCEHKC